MLITGLSGGRSFLDCGFDDAAVGFGVLGLVLYLFGGFFLSDYLLFGGTRRGQGSVLVLTVRAVDATFFCCCAVPVGVASPCTFRADVRSCGAVSGGVAFVLIAFEAYL